MDDIHGMTWFLPLSGEKLLVEYRLVGPSILVLASTGEVGSYRVGTSYYASSSSELEFLAS